jgi:ribosomal protein L12E/L44/L45/RPP1/RPP2
MEDMKNGVISEEALEKVAGGINLSPTKIKDIFNNAGVEVDKDAKGIDMDMLKKALGLAAAGVGAAAATAGAYYGNKKYEEARQLQDDLQAQRDIERL